MCGAACSCSADLADYLNRSQPPVFLHMVDAYIAATNDTSILPRALRAAEREMQFWANNRTITLTGPSGQSHNVCLWALSSADDAGLDLERHELGSSARGLRAGL